MPEIRPIVLLTDFGTKDAYAASMKGVILNLFPQAQIVDLTHEIRPQNLTQAAFLLNMAYPYFPPSSIFVSVVDPGVGSERLIIAAKTSHGIFLAPDNGLLTLILEKEKPGELRSVTNRRFFLPKVSSTFHGRDCFAPTAAWLAKKPALFSELGPRIGHFNRLTLPSPRITRGKVRGQILYFDRFGNAFTNITRSFLNSTGLRGRTGVRVKGKSLGPLQKSYFEVPKGKAVAVFSSTDILEIAVNHGSAEKKLGLKEGLPVEIG